MQTANEHLIKGHKKEIEISTSFFMLFIFQTFIQKFLKPMKILHGFLIHSVRINKVKKRFGHCVIQINVS